MRTYAIPVSGGRFSRSFVNASSPPAEAPMQTTGTFRPRGAARDFRSGTGFLEAITSLLSLFVEPSSGVGLQAPIGYDGVTYLPELGPVNTLDVLLPSGARCQANLTPPASSDGGMRNEVVICR